ncbi:MAG: DUF3795 domain-containing protein [Chloroflexi bacterium]|nr:DUF3795 domain-containing protein [Chloroflexota bacterium]
MIAATYPQVGVCGLSCRLCPRYHTETESRCEGCKTASRMNASCAFITCALKRKGIEFCWECSESATCERWQKHRAFGQQHDSFKCYQKLEADIAFIREKGVAEFQRQQIIREEMLRRMLADFNEGRSKSYYCVAATVMEVPELEAALIEAQRTSAGLSIKEKASQLRAVLDSLALQKGYHLKLRK